ncbi:leucine-rich repeat transmembrane neuronal protein 2-like [Anopheles ziemanni]|uniref:leucine-rich repeat transmembrane neuronal protein 2-like n=1 Tax=Anopheles coustani TaxID=139045 RepID=UPI002657D79A|nr:leucine-rich repeat transmembrane neuronal protein 2-like [Anopheles coustani]XP_058167079.1 leucine-rich repeat transmembrane neuronal protein 2-like [Anopheles ziemanni]
MAAILLPGAFPKQLQCTPEPDGSCSLIGSKVSTEEIMSTTFGSTKSPEKLTKVQFVRSSMSAIPPGLFQAFPKLEVVNGSACDVKQVFTRNYASAKALIELYLRGNKIHNLPEEAFFGASRLQTLDLTSNAIANIDETAFKRLRELKTLLLAENTLTELKPLVLNDLPDLETLHLQQNQLRTISNRQFQGTPSLTHLNISHNALKSFVMEQFERAWTFDVIDVSYNALTEVMIPNSLRELVAIGNGIRKIGKVAPDANASALTQLRLPHNKLDNVDSIPTFEKLIVLDLAYNQIRTFDFASIAKFTNLMLLKLDGNQLETVSNSLAQPITNLKYIHLADNHFVQFNLDVLRTVPRVLKLDLRRNRLEQLSVNDLSDSFPVLIRLMLEGNQLRCEANRKFVKELKSSIASYTMKRDDCTKTQNLIDGICCS